MTPNNETVSHQNLCEGSIAKSMASEGNSVLLPANVDRRPPLQVSPCETLRFSGNKINCFPLDQSLEFIDNDSQEQV